MVGISSEGGEGESNTGTLDQGESIIFFGGLSAVKTRVKEGAHNFLILTNSSASNCLVELDQVETLGVLPKNGGSIALTPIDGIRFSTVKLTSIDATQIAIAELKAKASTVVGV